MVIAGPQVGQRFDTLTIAKQDAWRAEIFGYEPIIMVRDIMTIILVCIHQVRLRLFLRHNVLRTSYR